MKNNASKAAVVLAEYVVLFNKARTAACPRCCVASWRPLAGGCVLPPSRACTLSPAEERCPPAGARHHGRYEQEVRLLRCPCAAG